MNDNYQMKLNTSCILNVPLQSYENNFTFIVNGKEFKTSRLISDLLSPIISKKHSIDPTFDTFTLNTNERGNFFNILNLVKFNQLKLSENEVPFISEVIEILGNDSIDFEGMNDSAELSTDNVFSLIKMHEKYNIFYKKQYLTEIDFISSHFYELCENQDDEFYTLSNTTIFSIINNDNLQLNSEDQLLKFVNKLYSKSSTNSILYETILFENTSSQLIKEFLTIFNFNDATAATWKRISKRLEFDLKQKDEKNKRYRNQNKSKTSNGKQFVPNGKNNFNGIINYLQSQSIQFNVTSSSIYSDNYKPQNAVLYNDLSKTFCTKNEKDSWLMFDFINHKVIPTNYTIRSYSGGQGGWHPKSWVIEGSNDKSSWSVIDEENNCSYLNDCNLVHQFQMNRKSSEEFQYIRMRLTDVAWCNNYYLMIDSFEIYGNLI